MARTDEIQLLAIDLRRVPLKLRWAFAFDAAQLEALFARARQQSAELAMIATPSSFELYASEPMRIAAFGGVLLEFARRRRTDVLVGAQRVLSLQGPDAARHLFKFTTHGPAGTAGNTSSTRCVQTAAARAAASGTLGPNLATLFGFASRAGQRVQRELGDQSARQCQSAEMVRPVLGRVLDEELAAWAVWCARADHLHALSGRYSVRSAGPRATTSFGLRAAQRTVA